MLENHTENEVVPMVTSAIWRQNR